MGNVRSSRPVARRSALVPAMSFVLATSFVLVPARAAAAFETDFEAPVFAEASDLYAKDHGLIRHTDGVYHLFYSVGLAGQGWNLPGNEIDLGHATSTDLEHWTIQPRILPINPQHSWKSRNIWAPHVIRADLEIAGQSWPYLMTYTGVDSSRNQQIGIAVSTDLFDWTDLSVDAGAFRPDPGWAQWDPAATWQNCRDSFVFRQGGELVLLASATTRPEYLGLGTRGAIALATSTDGVTWTDRGSPLVINDHWTLMASSHMVQNPVSGLWHLLYTRTVPPGGIHMLTSSSPTSGWDIATDTILDPSAISSEITVAGGTTIYSHAEQFLTQAGLETRAVRFDSLEWSGAGPTYASANPFWEEWTLVSGQLGGLPTYRDRAGIRSGVPSNMDGNFWVSTAEDDSGPYELGCPTCGPDETLTGVLRSRPFILEGLRMRLWVGGTASPLAYVALADAGTGEILRSAQGLGTDVMSEREWEVASLFGRTVYLEIADLDPDGHVSVDRIAESGEVVGLPPAAPAVLLGGLELAPNPTRGPAVLAYHLGQPASIALSIYGAGGRLVRRVAAGAQSPGQHEIGWDGRMAGGEPAPAGVYFFRLDVDGKSGGGAHRASPVTRLALVR